MLLLKYPPEILQEPQTFVEDAIYLRDNLNTAAGAKLVTKYSGKSPVSSSTTSAAGTPAGEEGPDSAERRFSRRKSPFPSSARFLHQQGGVDNLLKGVYKRGERLGINQVVRDAVGEVKRNIHSPDPLASSQKDSKHWSADSGIALPRRNKPLSALEARNKCLARLMNDALDDLRESSTPTSSAAIDRLQLIQVYLEDSSLPIPPESLDASTSPQASEMKAEQADPPQIITTDDGSMVAPRISENRRSSKDESTEEDLENGNKSKAIPQRPAPTIPTRSTLAQSSFAWMLEPDEQLATPSSSPSPRTAVPDIRRPVSASREKAAFLFGDESDGASASAGHSRPIESQDGFKLPTINK